MVLASETITIHTKQDIIDYVNERKTTKRTSLLLIIVLGTIFLDAYDLTILGTATDQLTQEFKLSPTYLSFIMTAMPFGALFGAAIGGFYADKLGRKLILSVSLISLIIGAIGAALSPAPAILLCFRLLMGFAIGMDSPVAFTFIAEISNKKDKGRNVNYWQVVWYIAVVSSALIVILLYSLGTGAWLWRYSVALGAVFATIILVLRLFYLSESPSWSMKNKTLTEASKELEKNYNINVNIEPNKGEDESFSKTEVKNPLRTLFNKRYRKRTILATSIATLQGMQYYAIGLYIPLIAIYIIGENKIESLSGTALINIAGIIGGLTGALLTTKYGARKLTIAGFSIVGTAMIIIGLFYGHTYTWLIALMVAFFLFGHSGGPGTQGKAIAALSYPTILRGKGTGFVESVSRFGSMFGTFIFPIILANLGLNKTMLLLALVPIVGIIITTYIKWEPVGKDVEHEDQYIEKV
ncbi:MFS transporter [Mammaliicoccus sciuri]|uniref:MFS transporter n=1 Tax=Mammaliicoccus sciuri TaxID=1296 RepID=UPI00198209A0|nr:MFS transporter [Mammaliicoccus sciuri]MCD8762245.1 MFS transporter [Mammaliicoccus sciuri]MCJ1759507.1 MFS transporter [Mammaliicoccus sciuri]MDT0756322.1 MFS transporter [Mammaliicoccus sciuri]MEB7816414.1 MFS transporter [Mammaliicoccus sciuri]WQJ42365.1 MFS transporter [Mammaliicoccus sciuri]